MVFLLNSNKISLCLIAEVDARKLLKNKRAAILKQYPFVLILKKKYDKLYKKKSYFLKIDPGIKTTAMVLCERFQNDEHLVFALHINHKTTISSNLLSRAASRRSRRGRKTRYRPARFLNRRRKKGYLAPSNLARLSNVDTWIKRLSKLANIEEVILEYNVFDMQKMDNPNIKREDYQNGPMKGYKSLREKLIDQDGGCCFYCENVSKRYEDDHIVPKANGGSDALFNRALSCPSCNREKTKTSAELFLSNKYKNDAVKLKYYLGKLKKKMSKFAAKKEATQMNLICKRIKKYLESHLIKYRIFSPEEMKKNRDRLFPNYIKSKDENLHWVDASCLGCVNTLTIKTSRCLVANSAGYGNRQSRRVDKFGFPCSNPKIRQKMFFGFRTGDMIIGSNKNARSQRGGIIGCELASKQSASLRLQTRNGKKIKISNKNAKKIHNFDGYRYDFLETKRT